MTGPAGLSLAVSEEPAVNLCALLDLASECIRAGQGALELQDVLDLLARLVLACSAGNEATTFACQRDLKGHVRVQATDTNSARRLDPVEIEGVLNAIGFPANSSPFLGPKLNQLLGQRLAAIGWPAQNACRMIGLRFGEGSSALGGAILSIPNGGSAHDLLSRLSEIAALGGTMLRACKAARMGGQAEATADTMDTMTAKRAAALELAADAYWEADVRLKVRKLVLLGSDERCRSLHGLEGMNLSLHLDVDKQGLESTFSGVRLRLPQADRSPIAVSVSGMRTRDADGWFGTAHLMDAQSAVRTDYSHAKDLVIRLEEARRSEAVLRAEAETVLDGLRILLRPEPSAKLFTALLARLAEPLEFQDAVILERDWTGDTHLCAATGDCLSAIDWSAFDPSLFDLEDLASLHVPTEILGADGPEGREIPPWASGLAIRLSGGSKPALLLCLHRVPGFFTQRHLGLGARLALVANQALLAEEERRKVVQAAKLASIGELAAGIVHEVNQPLSAIKLAVQGLELLLEDDKLTSEQLGAKLERVDGEVDRIANIVRAMRVLARKSDSEHAPFNVAEAANEAISIVRHRLRAEAIELLADIPETLTAHGSRLEFAQVVLNVVGNAIDAIRLHRRDNGAETNERRISVTAAVGPQGVVELCVRDTGPGVPQAQVDKVLEPFFTTKPSGEGTGLGLSLCQRMMRSMEGDIRIGNWEGGAEVRLELPSSPSITTLDDSHMERE